jgi:peptidoglycan/xylan/chitin deacetylase (PgdA/CDA1 family)
MRIPGVKTARLFSRWLQAQIFHGALILGYHRVADVAQDLRKVCVAPDHFEEHLQTLKKHANPISLAALVNCLKQGSLPPKSVVITFDDGYSDNLYQAKPLLEKYEIPATVFVTTGYFGKEFWWDELERLIVTSNARPGTLSHYFDEGQFTWQPPVIRGEADVSEQDMIQRDIIDSLYHLLLRSEVKDRDRIMNAIRSWSEATPPVSPAARALNIEELLRIAEGGLIEIGAHTKNHPFLPYLSVQTQQQEILSSKKDLENILERRVSGFAYPNGVPTKEARTIVREAGFEYACCSLRDIVRLGCDFQQLSRFWQEDVDGDKFMKGLRVWSPVIR